MKSKLYLEAQPVFVKRMISELFSKRHMDWLREEPYNGAFVQLCRDYLLSETDEDLKHQRASMLFEATLTPEQLDLLNMGYHKRMSMQRETWIHNVHQGTD